MEIEKYNLSEFNKAVLNGTATWWKMELPSGNVMFGTEKAKMLGYPDSDFKTYMDFTKLLHPEDLDKTMQSMKDHISGKTELYEAAYRIQNKNGEYIKFYDCGKIIKKEGTEIQMIGFVIKILPNFDTLRQMEDFKELILSGKPSIIDLFSSIKK